MRPEQIKVNEYKEFKFTSEKVGEEAKMTIDDYATALLDRVFEWNGERLRCKTTRKLSTGKLAITTMTKTIVLLESELANVVIKGVYIKAVSAQELAQRNYDAKQQWLEQNYPMTDTPVRDKAKLEPFTEHEDALIIAKMDGDIKIKTIEIAARLARTTSAISQRIYRLRQDRLKEDAVSPITHRAQSTLVYR